MDLRQLRYFIAIVEQGSFSKAAKLLNISQPALSLHVRNLESELGSALLFRSPQGVLATEPGKVLLRNAHIIVDQFSIAKHEITGLEAEPTGEVRLGLPAAISQILAVPRIIEVRQRFPKIRLKIRDAMSGFVLEWLREARIDLAVLNIPISEWTLVSHPVLSVELWLLGPAKARKGKQHLGKGPYPFNQLVRLPLILPSTGHSLRTLLEIEASNRAFELNTVLEADSYSNIKGLVEAGIGYSVLPFIAITAEVRAGKVQAQRISRPMLHRTVNLVRPIDRPLTTAVAAVETTCRSVLISLWLSVPKT